MNPDIRLVLTLAAAMALWIAEAANGAEASPAEQTAAVDLAKLVGQPADIAPSAYLYRADRRIQANPPETSFLFAGAVGHERDGVICGLLWEEPRPVSRIELTWPPGAKPVPRARDIVVRWVPHGNSSSWWSRRGGEARTANATWASPDGRRIIYAVDALRPESAMDNLVVALRDGLATPLRPYAAPVVRVFTPEAWNLMDVEIEWAFQNEARKLDFSGSVEAYNGLVGRPRPLPDDARTVVTGGARWQSKATGGGRRGIALRLLYLGPTQNTRVWRHQARLKDVNRTIVTVRTASGSFSFLPADLETGPILAPEYGFFVRAAAKRQGTLAHNGTRRASVEKDLLRTKVNSVAGNPAVRGWGSNDTPWFGANPAARPVRVSTFALPARSVAMHPGPGQPVAAGWRSPIAGRVTVRARLADADANGGNGVEWSVTADGKAGHRVLAGGEIDNGGAQSTPADGGAKPASLAVGPGDMISLVVAARSGNHGFDTTVVELVIAEVGGKQRVWNLTKDVVDSVQAGNPHADSLGNGAVWCFHAPVGTVVPSAADRPVLLESRAISARGFVRELAGKGLKTIRRRVRAREEQTWEAAMRALHGTRPLPPYPKPDFEPPAEIDVPQQRLVDAWRVGAWHLLRVLKKDARGRYIVRDFPYDALAHETHLILRALDLQGMHKAARDGLARWLDRDATKPTRLDGQFADSIGILGGVEWDWQHLGGPGVMQWQMVEHYLFTGDKEWLRAAAPKLRANADWMIRQRKAFMKDTPGRQRAWCRGLLPPHNIWDSTNWRLWYESNVNYWFGLKRYAEVIADVDPDAGRKYRAEAKAYAGDILAAAEKSLVLSPVVRVGDGTYRSFLPPAPYIRGPASRHMPTSFGDPRHTPGLYADAIRGGVHFLHVSGLLPRTEPRAQGLLDVLEDRLLLEHHRLPMRTRGYDPRKHWFGNAGWYYQCGIERTPNVHLQWDDVPNFLRSFYNHYAVDVVVGPYTFNEHTTRGPSDKSFEEAAFLERLRNMLVMEEGDALWLARATPRAWLAQGKRVATKNMPTHFGTVSYEIVSDAGSGRITATVEMPSRQPPGAVFLRLRHPNSSPIRSVTVSGKPWKDFDSGKEVIRLTGGKGEIRVVARY